jgi:hypothetical protein
MPARLGVSLVDATFLGVLVQGIARVGRAPSELLRLTVVLAPSRVVARLATPSQPTVARMSRLVWTQKGGPRIQLNS